MNNGVPFKGIVIATAMNRGNSGGYDDYIDLTIATLDGQANQRVIISTLGQLPALFVYEKALDGSALILPESKKEKTEPTSWKVGDPLF